MSRKLWWVVLCLVGWHDWVMHHAVDGSFRQPLCSRCHAQGIARYNW